MQEDRRMVLKAVGALTVAGAAGGALGLTTRPAGAGRPIPEARRWITLLAKSLTEEHDYIAKVEGQIPAGLRGTLYRNGPGLFERNGVRKRNLLDGDGMIQAFDFLDGKVRYRNRFVQTAKFREEAKAGRYLHATWSTLAPGGMFANLGASAKSQAGVTTLVKHGKLLAFDEVNPPCTLDPYTLKTEGSYAVEEGKASFDYKAHTKTDAKTGDWLLFGTGYGRDMHLHHLVLGPEGRLKAQGRLKSPRSTYLHDFFATERYVVFVLHPVDFSPFAMLLGMRSFIDSLRWNRHEGNLIVVADKNGKEKPVILEAPAAFMWHSLNAYERGGTIVAEFVGYDEPDHFIGDDPDFRAIMEGREGTAREPGRLRRYLIDPAAKTVREEKVAGGHFEFPIADPRVLCHASRYAHLSYQSGQGWYHDGVARVDMTTGKREGFGFGPSHYVGEPIFASAGPSEGEGWLLAQTLDGTTGKSFLAIFDARKVEAGPVARVLLDHHVPISFHGYWQDA